jgi:hypothetical protein
MTTIIKRTQDELVAELKARFGENPLDWAFQCPACKDVATAEEFSEAIAADPEREGQHASEHIGQVCIGRLLGALSKDTEYAGRGCDWAAFGLFRGPEFVVMPDGREVPSFPIAPAPAAVKA